MATKKKAPAKKKPAPKVKVKAKAAPKAKAAGADSGELALLKARLEEAEARAASVPPAIEAAELRAAQAEKRMDEAERKAQSAGLRAAELAAEVEKMRAASGADRQERERSGKRVVELEEALAGARRKLAESVSESEEMRVQLHAAEVGLASYKLRCPKCGQNFEEELYEGITIDRCTGCDAIYFDAGEVELLIAKINAKETPNAPEKSGGFWSGLFKRKPKPSTSGEDEGPPGDDTPPAA
jgi:chromosome segregation ATPase